VTGPLSNPEPAGIVTPEAVLLEFETAGAGSRAGAELLDVLLQLLVLFLIGIVMLLLAASGGTTEAVIAYIVVVFLVIVGYPVAMESMWNGRTLGKAVFGLRVVTVEGGPVRFRHAAIRGIFGVFEIYAVMGSVALMSIILTRRDQRLGDLSAGTILLRERTAPANEAVAVRFFAPYGLESYVATLDVTALTNDQYGVVRSFLMRVMDLSPEARGGLAVKLANATALELRLTPPQGLAPEPFLVCVAAAYQNRHGGPPPSPAPPSGYGYPPPPPPPPAPGAAGQGYLPGRYGSPPPPSPYSPGGFPPGRPPGLPPAGR
jgi:uncharacterized RDD family membrane protein YckC